MTSLNFLSPHLGGYPHQQYPFPSLSPTGFCLSSVPTSQCLISSSPFPCLLDACACPSDKRLQGILGFPHSHVPQASSTSDVAELKTRSRSWLHPQAYLCGCPRFCCLCFWLLGATFLLLLSLVTDWHPSLPTHGWWQFLENSAGYNPVLISWHLSVWTVSSVPCHGLSCVLRTGLRPSWIPGSNCTYLHSLPSCGLPNTSRLLN